ncbi:MAG: translation initiation factor IF-1 [Endomicrobia bacterium]|nr:translation initiation factor IF-1 [Endomicrobiia bacterium]MCX7941412.1 translation initiation factor IF-1 [Endomicrobiia bacterium]MDW8055484.1 translation initiation factor IF-1 [Elusimicrobiota bacterium]
MEKRQDKIVTEGTIVEVLPATMFRVKIDNTQHIVLAHLSGKMRLNFVQLVEGDRVKLEMSPYDLTKARIVCRLKPGRK